MVDFRKSKYVPSTLPVNNSEVEIVDSFNFLGIHISSNLSWFIMLGTKRSPTFIFPALPQEISNETINPSQFLSQYYQMHFNRVDYGTVWQYDIWRSELLI